MRVAIYTLGCKVNQYETQALENELTSRGHTLVPLEGPCDAYIVNTCTVTAVSDKKSRSAIRRARRENPAAVVGVCGCYAQTDPAAVKALGVDLISGTGDRLGFLDALEKLAEDKMTQVTHGDGSFASSAAQTITLPLTCDMKESSPCAARAPRVLVDDIMTHRAFEHLSAGGMEGRTRAMLKVEDGCVNFCSYCIIPYARGPVRSLSVEDAVAEVRRLATGGYREIVLTGIEISSWGDKGTVFLSSDGKRTGEPLSLIDLVEAVCAAAPGLRIRLGSLEPRTITEAFCRRAARLPNLCPHFHLSLQSGCDATLRRMNRKYDCGRYYESVGTLRKFFPDVAVTTDLIVGFPGETEEEFAATLAFIRKCAFASMHIFPYSRRVGTPAAVMDGQIPKAVKDERARTAAAVAADMKHAYLTGLVGRTLPVLFEEKKDNLWRGHAPNYVEVYARGEELHNQVKLVQVTALCGEGVEGVLMEEDKRQ